MTQKHTLFPANFPFTLQHDDDEETIIVDSCDNEVCQVFAPDVEREEMGAFIVEAMNNHERLKASNAELLEALQLCHAQLSLYVADIEQSPEDKEALDKATAAIAKAEGK